MSRITLDNYEAFLLDFSEGKLSGEELRELDCFFALHPELDVRSELSGLPTISASQEAFDVKEDLLKSELYLEDEELLNYVEGLSSADEATRFEKELESNTELRKNFRLYQATKSEADIVQFDKSFLYKSEEDQLLLDNSLNYIEGCLSGAALKGFEETLASSPSLQKDVALLSKTKLQADLAVVFENKESLKKEARVVYLFAWRTVARVAAVLLLVFSLLLPYYLKNGPAPENKIAKVETRSEVKSSTDIRSTEHNSAVSVVARQQNSDSGVKNEGPVKNNDNKERAVETKETSSQPLLANSETKSESKTESDAKSNSENQSVQPQELVQLSEKPVNEEPLYKKDSLPMVESFASIDELKFSEEIEEMKLERPERGFWKKAVGLARRANELGVKSIEGEENTGVKFRLSFNSFSVEKR